MMGEPIDILIPFIKSGNEDVELRLALRAIHRYAAGVRNIYVVGQDPGFLAGKAFHVSCPMFFSLAKDARIALQLLWAFDRQRTTEEVCMWNDDFMLTDFCDIRILPRYQKGITLEAAAAKHRSRTYKATLAATGARLQAAGHPAMHYDLHCPMRYERACFRNLWRWWDESARSKPGFVVKSIYANIYGDPSTDLVLSDVKFMRWPGLEVFERTISDRWVFSYGDVALKGGLRAQLESLYPEKSPYEQ